MLCYHWNYKSNNCAQTAPPYLKWTRISPNMNKNQEKEIKIPEKSYLLDSCFRRMLLAALTSVSGRAGRTGPLQLPHSINQNNEASRLTRFTHHRTLCSQIISRFTAGCCADWRQHRSRTHKCVLFHRKLTAASAVTRALRCPLTNSCHSSCASSWPGRRGRFCSGMFW